MADVGCREAVMTGPIVLASLLIISLSELPFAGQANTGQLPAPGAQATAEKPWPPADVLRAGDGVKAPKVIKDVKPNYTAAAMNAKIAGVVTMEAVVGTDGTVRAVRVTKSLDREFGLDDEAVRTLKLWRFAPGTQDDVPVPVLVVVEMMFTLRK